MNEKPATSAQAALAKARRHLGLTALASAIVPLSSIAAQASVALPTPTITATVKSVAGGGYQYDYRVANNGGGTINLIGIELPELTAGDLNFGTFLQPSGWSAQQSATAQFPGSFAGAKNGAKSAAYIDLIFQGGSGNYALTAGNPLDFNALSSFNGTTSANVSVETGSNSGNPSYVQVDPPIPNSAPAIAPVPEPASAAILGTGLLALFARKRRNT